MITTDPSTGPQAGQPIHGTLPAIGAPPAFRERRAAIRRGEDQALGDERALLARTLDILAGPGDAVEHLAGILVQVARIAGARRAALLVQEPARRVTVAIGWDEPGDAGDELAAWLDAHAPRSAARRAADVAAPVSVVRALRDGAASRPGRERATGGTNVLVQVAGQGGVHLGVEVPPGVDAQSVAARLPASMLRNVLVALSIASSRAADDRER